MKTPILLLVAVMLTMSTLVSDARQAPPKRLRAFQSEAELQTFLRTYAEEQRRARRQLRVGGVAGEPMAPPPAVAESVSVSGAAAPESITNVQHAGVDEGGIVKLRGNHLVVLRRGRLFTIDIGHGQLTPVSAVDAFGQDINPNGTWYDELLVSGDKVVVVGYSYARGGTEIGLFDLDTSGQLQYRSTYHLRSNDYYSSRNYSSRLIGTKLVFYTPLYFAAESNVPLPALRKWHQGATDSEFRRIASARRIYRPAQPPDPTGALALHTVTSCELARVDMECDATVVIGPPGRVFYVSPRAVYVWTTDWIRSRTTANPRSTLYALPLDGSAPGALQVSGAPTDQFSFLESDDDHLNVLVRSDGRGDAMWSAERGGNGAVALLRVPLSMISDGTMSAPSSHYRGLPAAAGTALQNRFIGDFVFYGPGSGWGRPAKVDRISLHAVRWRGGEPIELSLPHTVDRLEPMGSHAAVIGTDGSDLHFTTLRLGRAVTIAGRYTRPNASQGELRSHGFFYKPNDADTGILGLPITREGRPGYKHLFENSAAIAFLRNDALQLQPMGELDSDPEKAVDDACRASCVDWYGNARPLFINGRIFALLGYEIVEGAVRDGRLQEARRMNYAPVVSTRR